MDNRKKHHYFIKILASVILFLGIVVYAAEFPTTMSLFDKQINKIIASANIEYECTLFKDFSVFSKETVNEIRYLTEIIRNNAEGVFEEIKPVQSFIINCSAKFPLESKNITSFFGERIDPFSKTESFHTGIDAAAPFGSKVYAAWPGEIVDAGYDSVNGNYIVIKHSFEFTTKYCHLSEILISVGDFANVDTVIGKAGSTGRSTGSHLHFEVEIEGHKIDPMECFGV